MRPLAGPLPVGSPRRPGVRSPNRSPRCTTGGPDSNPLRPSGTFTREGGSRANGLVPRGTPIAFATTLPRRSRPGHALGNPLGHREAPHQAAEPPAHEPVGPLTERISGGHSKRTYRSAPSLRLGADWNLTSRRPTFPRMCIAVSSALWSLTAVFGMGTGVTSRV